MKGMREKIGMSELYFNRLTIEQAKRAVKLPPSAWKFFKRPDCCGFEGALDRQFGCPFLIRYTLKGVNVVGKKCVKCTCAI